MSVIVFGLFYYYSYYLAFYLLSFAVNLKLLVQSMVLLKPDAPEILYYKCWLGLGMCPNANKE